MTSNWRIGRRSLLRGAGVTIALPLLDVMRPAGRLARAAAPKRFVPWFQPGGSAMSNWRPAGGETDFTLGPILKPLEPFRRSLIVLDGLDYLVNRMSTGNNHYKDLAAFLTGHVLLPGNFSQLGGDYTGWCQGPSLDQVLADKIGASTKFKSIELAVRWPSATLIAPNESGPRPTNVMCYKGADLPVAPTPNPQQVFDRLFGGGVSGGSGTGTAVANDREAARARSILDRVMQEYRLLLPKVSADDRKKLDSHLTSIRELETSLSVMTSNALATAACKAPDNKAALEGLMAPANVFNTDANQARVGQLMLDMLAMALICDLTRVASLQWSDPRAEQTFPHIAGLATRHHVYQHSADPGRTANLTKICTWYSEQLAYLLGKLSAVSEGDTTVLDSTLVYVGTELSDPNAHSPKGIPFLLVGGGSAFRTGRYLKYPSNYALAASHQNLLVSIQNAFGIANNTFGKRETCMGPLSGL